MALAGGLWLPTAHAAPVPTPVGPPVNKMQTQSETTASAQARRTGAKVEVAGEGSETSKVMANPDGTFTMSTYTAPVRVKRGSAWVPIETSLKPTADGLLAPAASAEDVKFSNGGSSPLATVSTHGKTVSFSWPTPLPVPQVSGATAVYPSVLPGVDLQLTAQADDYSEVLVVHDATAAANPALKAIKITTATTGLTLSADHNGLSARDGSGAEVLHGSTPIMWDSTAAPNVGPPPSATSPGSGHVTALSVTQTPSTSELTIAPDPAALTGPGVIYPLYIDPQMSGRTQHWLVVSSSGPRESIFDDSTFPQQVGYCGDIVSHCNNIGTARSYFQIDTSPLQQRAGYTATIHSAYFYATEIHQYSRCTDEPVNLYEAGPIHSGIAFPGPTGAFISQASSHAGDTCGGAAPVQFAANQLAADAANGNWINITVALLAPNESDGAQWKTFAPTDAHLDVTYNFPPNTPTGLHVSHEVSCNGGLPTTSDTTPTLYSSATDNNDSPLPLGLQFQLWNKDATKQLAANPNLIGIANDTEGGWTVPKSLADDQYAFRATTINMPADGADWLTSNWSDWYSFIARTGPFDETPTAFSFDYPEGYWGSAQGTPGTFQLQANVPPGTANPPHFAGITYTFDGAGTEAIPSTGDCNLNKTFGNDGGWIATTSGNATLTVPSGLSPGYHTLNLRTFDDAHRLSPESPTYAFYVAPNVGVTKTKLEAELNTDVTPSQPAGQNIPMTTQQGGELYSNGWQLFFPGNADQQKFDLTFTTPLEADYALGAEMTKSTDYGRVTVTLDGKTPLAGTDKTPFDGHWQSLSRAYLPLNGAHLTKGTHTLTFTLNGTNSTTGNRYQVGIDYLTVAPLNNVIADNFTDAMNNHGIAAAGSPVNLDFNGAGLVSSTLSNAGLAPGQSTTIGGATFTMPAPNTNGNDNVVAVGQTIPFPANQQVKASAVGLLAVSTCGNTPATPGTITYQDTGHTHSNPQFPTVTDWIGSSADGAAFVLDQWSGGDHPAKPKVFAIFAPTDPGKTLESITLPNIGTSFRSTICDNALHVLAIGVRPVQAGWLGAWAAPIDHTIPAPADSDANRTMRIIAHPTVTGANARVRLSNTGVPTPSTLDHVTIARQAGTGAATSAAPAQLTFCAAAGKPAGCGLRSITIPAGGEVYSDPVALPSGTGDLAISYHSPNALNWLPVHAGSSTPTYSAAGDVSGNVDGAPFVSAMNTTAFVTGVDISTTDNSQGTIVVLGDQTSAAGSTGGTWVDKVPGKVGSALPGSIVNDSKVGLPPIARWKLDDGSGTTAKDSVGTNPGTVTGGVTWSSDHGGSAVFNGRDSRITTAGPVLDTTGSYSISAWVYAKSASNYMTAVGAGGQQSASAYLQYNKVFNAWTFISPSTDVLDPSDYPAVHASSPPTLNKWTHLLAVFDATSGTMKLYIDGALVGTTTNPTPWKATSKLSIGAVTPGQTAADDFFNGSISDVRVYQQALTSTDAGVLAHGDAPTGPVGGVGAPSARTAGATLNQTVTDEPNLRTVVVSLGANDILAGDSAATVEASLTKLIKATSADGLKQINRVDGTAVHVIVTTIAPLGLSPNDPREQQRQLLNSDIRQSAGSYGEDGFIDFDQAVRDGGNVNQVASQYLTSGSPNDSYYNALVQALLDAMNAFPPQADL
ncbi:LamG-like jellyroll fold domain-containing protein [Kutzneria buriramensis]|uniref:LamG-like jellyroll fold domain-containing protein n=1 Tax=Kutzneria buriramensis TaxID=1045776 RepID=UPI000E23BD76|nr:LamG-like jellyroll fold domain-containing protein [Kutzneria buriramensis]